MKFNTSENAVDPSTPTPTSDTYAALDLGSNSFHLLVARDRNGTVQVLDRHREMTRIATGLETNGYLSQECIDRAYDSLQRISQRIRSLPHRNVRVVGTSALRQAANRDTFISQAEAILGHNIDIISGKEEGRLVYAGVSRAIGSRNGNRLVIDIGGGSTEFIAGREFQPRLTESLHVGSIAMTERWFKDGKLTASRMRASIQDMQRELEVIKQSYRVHGWEIVIGTSGSVLAVHKAIAQFTNLGITKATLNEVSRRLVQFGHIDNIDRTWCSNRRAKSLAGGIAILQGCFKTLNLDTLEISTSALREGLLYELIGRAHDDVRERTVRSLIQRFHIDNQHATVVAQTALTMFDQLYAEHDEEHEDERQLLNWSALLHEIGMNISHIAYHKHGAYLLEHLDVPGFTLTEQAQLAWLVRSHRRRLQVEHHMPHGKSLLHLCVILRLAVTLQRNRANDAIPSITLKKAHRAFLLELSRNWLNVHPLTRMDLEQEVRTLEEANVTLRVLER